MRGSPLSPLGILRRRFAPKTDAEGQKASPELPEALVAAAKASDLPEDLVELAWEVSRWAMDLSPEDQRSLALIVLASLLLTRQGSTYLPLGQAQEPALRAALIAAGAAPSELSGVLRLATQLADPEGKTAARVIGPLEAVTPLARVVAQGSARLYHRRLLEAEQRLARALRTRWSTTRALAPDEQVRGALKDVLARPSLFDGRPISLSEAQKSAVEVALVEPFLVITGGPGTGKTSIVQSILRALARRGLSADVIALAAPTGKAANRLEAAIKRGLSAVADPSPEDVRLLETLASPQTLHRLLGFQPRTGRFLHHENFPLAARLVIVDEASMIDVMLVDRLFRALARDARLILLGDADQLPSVEAGAVLRDLVLKSEQHGRPRVVRLTESHRTAGGESGRAILETASALNQGRGDRLFLPDSPARVHTRLETITFEGVELIDASGPKLRRGLLELWYRRRIRGLAELERLVKQTYLLEGGRLAGAQELDAKKLLSHLESVRVLTLTRGEARPTGATAVNSTVHRERLLDLGLSPRGKRESGDFLPGEPVLMEVNDYGRDLFNGDFGVVLRVADRERPAEQRRDVAFATDDHISLFPLDVLRADLSLAYAMTVHKAQGSEFDQVLLLLPEEDIALATRELVYTAVTRAKGGVLIAGRPELLVACSARRLERFSGLDAGDLEGA